MPINEKGDVVASESLAQSANAAQRDAREDKVDWSRAPEWAAVYAVQNRFGNTAAKWWGAIGDAAAEYGAIDQNKNADAPIYFKLNDGEPLKMFRRPSLRAEAMNRVGEVSDQERGVHFTGHGMLREGENTMAGKVFGYRKLSDAELQLVNDIKAVGAILEGLLDRASCVRPWMDSEDTRLNALAKTNFQQGAMWLISTVTKKSGLF